MGTPNTVLMKMARQSLKGNWAIAIGAFFVHLLINCTISSVPTFGPFIVLFTNAPLILGAASFSLAISRGREATFELSFSGFNNYGKALATYLLMLLYVLLWALLLIIPGIIAALSYSMAFYVLADNPSLTPGEALRISKRMMVGYKWKLFGLMLLFILLVLLCILTLGIGLLWLIPYTNVTMAKFYDDIREQGLDPQELEDSPILNVA